MDKEQTYDSWLTEDWLLDEIERTPDMQMRLERLYDYIMLLKEYEEELGLEEQV
jgi:hypothetical protein